MKKARIIKKNSRFFHKIGIITKESYNTYFIKIEKNIYRKYYKTEVEILENPKENNCQKIDICDLYYIRIADRFLQLLSSTWILTNFESHKSLVSKEWIMENCKDLWQFAIKSE